MKQEMQRDSEQLKKIHLIAMTKAESTKDTVLSKAVIKNLMINKGHMNLHMKLLHPI